VEGQGLDLFVDDLSKSLTTTHLSGHSTVPPIVYPRPLFSSTSKSRVPLSLAQSPSPPNPPLLPP